MIGSFISGLSGLRSNQTRLEVIGNNIANANTVGFKSSRVDFSDVLSRTLRGATAATAPVQVGRGTSVGAISTQMTQGGFQDSANASDLAIQGNGFFVVADSGTGTWSGQGRPELGCLFWSKILGGPSLASRPLPPPPPAPVGWLLLPL